MRRCLSLIILLAFALAVPALAAESGTASKAQHQTWEQRFSQANLAHDGHLTLDEAKGGFKLIAKYFNEIDIEHRGYVTENDIRAWRILRKAARKRQPVPDRLKLLHAFQWRFLDLPETEPMSPGRAANLQSVAQATPRTR